MCPLYRGASELFQLVNGQKQRQITTWSLKMAGDLVATPPKFNMEPKNEGLEDVFPFHMGDSQVFHG